MEKNIGKIIFEFLEFLLTGGLFTTDHTLLAFVSLAIGTTIYGFLMIDDYEVDNWKVGLICTAGWLFFLILGMLLSTEDFRAIREGKAFSGLFVFGLVGLSLAYTVISYWGCSVRDIWLVQAILLVIAYWNTFACLWFLQMLTGQGI